MSIQPDSWIKKMCKEHNMIEPFLDHQVSEGKISYGLSSMGYDVRISDEYRIFTNVNSSLVEIVVKSTFACWKSLWWYRDFSAFFSARGLASNRTPNYQNA